MLFRMALFGAVQVQAFPPHPYSIPPSAVCRDLRPPYQFEMKTFTYIDALHEFLYSHWFRGLIPARLKPTMEYREACGAAGQRKQTPQQPTGKPVEVVQQRRGNPKWYEAKTADVAATVCRLRQEVDALISRQGAPPQGQEKIRLKRFAGKRVNPGASDASNVKQEDHCVEMELLDPSILPMAQPARLEFLSLVSGVTSMLLERLSCFDPKAPRASGNNCPPVQVLSVPANTIVLAAVKVSVSLIPPHFDHIAPTLLDWVDARCRLIQWLWKSCGQELRRRAEEKWIELWNKCQPGQRNTPRLELRFIGPTLDEKKPGVELTLNKL